MSIYFVGYKTNYHQHLFYKLLWPLHLGLLLVKERVFIIFLQVCPFDFKTVAWVKGWPLNLRITTTVGWLLSLQLIVIMPMCPKGPSVRGFVASSPVRLLYVTYKTMHYVSSAQLKCRIAAMTKPGQNSLFGRYLNNRRTGKGATKPRTLGLLWHSECGLWSFCNIILVSFCYFDFHCLSFRCVIHVWPRLTSSFFSL